MNSWSAPYLEAAYARFKADPMSAEFSDDLRAFFQGFDLGLDRSLAVSESSVAGGSPFDAAVGRLVDEFRARGHVIAKTDPFGRERPRPKDLTLAEFGLTEADLDRPVSVATFPGISSLRDLIAELERVYCGTIGIEYMHIPDEAERAWFRGQFERAATETATTPEVQLLLLEQLTAVERFESFLGKRFQGKKRFSIEGGEGTIPLLKAFTQRAGELGVQEIIAGMAHRGRLAVLRQWVGKDLPKLFTEFKDSWVEGTNQGGGDVKYHRGYSGDQALIGSAAGKVVHLSMLNNPSHLESQDAVVLGRCRAKQDIAGDAERRRVVSVLIHGDGAVIGQGVVAECLNMSKLEGYDVGGTLHVVINNLVGFTTDPEDDRSTMYCTDIAKIINAPVLHVNGDDPEAVHRAAVMACDYRHTFRKDVFVDLVCFRRYGHNESDEPSYTQPELYKLVGKHPGTPETYRRRLVLSGAITQERADAMVEAALAELDQAYEAAAKQPVDPVPPPGGGLWSGLGASYSFDSPKTAVDAGTIAEVCAALGRVPDGFGLHPKLNGLLQARAALPKTDKLSHADAELIAIGTLALEGVNVRLSGQDSRRGTFTQRHGVFRDQNTGERYTPLNNIRPEQAGKFSAWDSPLSEYSVMGFDYGYSRANPRALVMWEAQFGDFCNTAQVVIDQYMAASEVKWNRWAGLVLLLPHGYEGQGPEHSSGRIERFLQLCADSNMEVVYPSTGAQMFHLLRRQVLRNFRKPLIVMTPKKYLRIETATVSELSSGSFRHIYDDPAHVGDAGAGAAGVKSVLYCSGKFYHELNERRVATGRKDVAIVRIEQLYPLHTEALRTVNARYPKAATRSWVQEEPRNQGAFFHIADRFREELGLNLSYLGRAASASPATGSERVHGVQQEAILKEAIGAAPAATGQNGQAANGAAAKSGVKAGAGH
ncbi:MAG: 2-oxoglutarate dehydrogenase E1 component [Phycisphaerales bacterium]|nr:2-oxoglutarate dehydrogenase E1 component [Phycisphaerales bacterium]